MQGDHAKGENAERPLQRSKFKGTTPRAIMKGETTPKE